MDYINIIVDSGIVTFIWLLLGSSFFTYGSFLARKLTLSLNGKEGAFAKIWIGLAFTILFFAVLNLFCPIHWLVSSLFYLPASFIFFKKYGPQTAIFIKSELKNNFTSVVAALTIGLIIAFALQNYQNYDSKYYHLLSIRWLNEYSIVPGLGNLHSRLGFNQLFFLFPASIAFRPLLTEYACHSAPTFLFALFLLQAFTCRKAVDYGLLFSFTFIPVYFDWISSPTPDWGVLFLLLISFRYLSLVFLDHIEKTKQPSYIGVAAICASMAVTIKISATFLGLGLGLISLIYSLKQGRSFIDKNIIKRVSIFIGILVFVWILRGYIQTGYPLFPSTLGKINFDWTVDESLANKANKDIYVYSRLRCYDYNSPLLTDFKWLKDWLHNNCGLTFLLFKKSFETSFIYGVKACFYLLLPNQLSLALSMLILVFLSIINLIICKIHNIKQKVKSNNYAMVGTWIIAFICLIIWFFLAPCPRFSNAIPQILFLSSFLILNTKYPNLLANNQIKSLILFLPFIALLFVYCNSYKYGDYEFNGVFKNKAEETYTKKTTSGLEIHILEDWKFPFGENLISTPPDEFNSNLRLRGENPSQGFTTKP